MIGDHVLRIAKNDCRTAFDTKVVILAVQAIVFAFRQRGRREEHEARGHNPTQHTLLPSPFSTLSVAWAGLSEELVLRSPPMREVGSRLQTDRAPACPGCVPPLIGLT